MKVCRKWCWSKDSNVKYYKEWKDGDKLTLVLVIRVYILG